MKASRIALPVEEAGHWTKVPSGRVRGLEEIGSNHHSSRMSKSSTTTSSRKHRKAPRRSHHNKRPSPLYTIRSVAEDAFLDASFKMDGHDHSSSVAEVPMLLQQENSSCSRPGLGSLRDNDHDNDTAIFTLNSEHPSSMISLWSSNVPSNRFHAAQCKRGRSFWEEDPVAYADPKTWSLTNVVYRWFQPNSSDVEHETNCCCDPILVSVHVLGSSGSLKLLVDKHDSVLHTIDRVLHSYASQKRQPELGLSPWLFGLYCYDPDFEELEDSEPIGERNTRHFHLYHKQGAELERAVTVHNTGHVMASPNKTSNWEWSSLTGMHSLVTKLRATFSHSLLSLWMTCLNPWRFDHIFYTFFNLIRSIKLSLW